MCLAEEFFCAIMDVGYFAKKNKVPSLLAKTMSDIAHHLLEEWRADKDSIKRFATEMLATDDLRYKSWEFDGDIVQLYGSFQITPKSVYIKPV